MPTPIQTPALPIFMGNVRHTLDGKNRLTIPSAWRFAEEAELFLIPSLTSACLTAMPRTEIDRIRAGLTELSGTDRTSFLRHFGSRGHQVWLDKNGRFSLPENFCSDLKLVGEVTLNGAIDWFEIWNNAAWSAAHPGTKAVAEPILRTYGL